MTAVQDHPAAPVITRRRVRELDALRGLAIALMIVDHAVLALDGPVDVRTTLGRVAMPLFFVIGGHLAVRASWRWARVVAVGLVVGLLVPWSGAFELLAWFVAGAATVVVLRRTLPGLLWVLVAAGLTWGANGYAELTPTGGYAPLCLLGLMAAGALISRDTLTRAGAALGPLRTPLAAVGRFPLSVYAGHLLLLAAVT